ncbi:NIPA-like protein 2 isoform X4 [Peromyscus californicus insignis]|uniref:NIPA-like protein 2 isoform X4 n=1 Tax=Peromyscus californicus insignis TaxID=564181 RepID=UPI0022A70ABC|nr:NIPA-like protein 2 isoform X4 [Peromyscus californicus insignis]
MAARVPAGPEDDASAVLDELSRNFTYWAPGPGNGSLSSAWYRRNQKYSHLHLAQKEHPKPYFKSVLWWSGVLLMATGEVGNFAAYGVAPITLIAPLGCMSVTGSAIISVIFLKENLRASDLLGMTLAFAGTYLLVNFAPNMTQDISARTVQYYFVGWQFLVYVILEILVFCILLYFHKRKGMKHIVILLTLVALLASLTVISVKAVSGMITLSVTGKMQLTYAIFYIMLVIMVASCVFQVKFLNQATKLYTMTTVVPVNHVFFTTSAIIAGIIFYQEFLGAALLTVFIYLFGCFLSFLGVFLVTRNRENDHLQQSFIDFGNIPGKQMLDKIQPDSNGLSYGTLPDGSDSTRSQSGEKKEA